MKKIHLNGQPRDIPESFSLAQLLQHLNVNSQQVAIAKNLEIVVHSELTYTSVEEGDEIEIFHAVGGGVRIDDFRLLIED